jgi:hypothetical protein
MSVPSFEGVAWFQELQRDSIFCWHIGAKGID